MARSGLVGSALLGAATLGMVYTYEGELLHQASIHDQEKFLTDLLDAGGNGTVKSRDLDGRTPLHTAASHGSAKCVKVLLQRGADPNSISGIEDQCSTPVHHAASKGHLVCLAELLEYEVNLELKNHKGKKAIDLARDEGTNDCRKCAEHIEKVAAQRKKEVEIAKCEALYDVIDDCDYERAKELLESIEDPYSIINRYYRGPNTLLYRASIGGNIDIIQLLMDYKADGRPNAVSGMTPLYAACHAGHYDLVVKLVEKYPKHLIIPATVEEYYPLHVAVLKGHLGIIRYLLKHRRMEEPKPRRTTTLNEQRSASFDSSTNQAEEYYVEVNQTIKSGYTALHLAVMYGNLDVLKILMTCQPIVKESQCASSVPVGGLVIDKQANEKSPFHHAVVLNKPEVAEHLLQHGADVNKSFDSTESSRTPLQYACKHELMDMVKVLLKSGALDTENVARKEALIDDKEEIVQLLLNHDVQSSENTMVLAASEMDLGLKSVFISWSKKELDFIKEDWILNAGIGFNEPSLRPKLKNDLGLALKMFTSIDLSNNNLESIPLILFQMPSLKTLNISENRLTCVPVPALSISSNTESTNSEAESFTIFTQNWNCASLENLDMHNNKLKELPKNVFQLPNLNTANFSWNEISALPFEMWFAPALKNLFLEHNKLKTLPVFTSGFFNQQSKKKNKDSSKSSSTPKQSADSDVVDGRKKDFATLPQFYSKRPSWNQDSDESDGGEEVQVVKKCGLRRLDLSDNEFIALPYGLPCLAPYLGRLNLSKNNIVEVDSLSSLPEHLMALDMSENGMKTFNAMAGKEGDMVNNMCYALVSRQSLRNSIPQPKRKTCQHRKHKQLTDLNRLILSKNSLEVLQVKTDKSNILFPDLRLLDISGNKLSKVPDGIGKLTNLSTLSLSRNTNIEALPSELGLCVSLFELKINHLKLKDPPKNVIEKTTTDGHLDVKLLIGYLKSLHDNAQTYPNIKLMVVGIHGIGKTTLLDLLRKEGTGSYRENEYPLHFNDRRIQRNSGNFKKNKSTVGVDVSDWSFGKKQQMVIKFSTWDFAGQTEYYATHQCFLSKRALYLCLWKITHGTRGIEQMEQWLLNIQARAPNCSVIIVGTFLDEADKKRKGYLDDMRKQIKKRFVSNKFGGGVENLSEKGLPKVVDIIEVSCKNGRNINKLRELIYDSVMDLKNDDRTRNTASLLETKIPKSYIDVEKAVTKIAEDLNGRNEMPVVDQASFRKRVYELLTLQGAELRNGNDEMDQAVQFLHDYGILLHYDDPALRDLYFVDPQWLCDMLAHVVTVRDVNPFIKNGVLKITDLQTQIFKGEKRFPSAMVMKYVELMSKFEVAIKISEKFLLIPSLLPDKQKECPVLAEQESSVLRKSMNIRAYLDVRVHRRQYLMSYVPTGFWARLLTRLIADDRIGKIVSSCCEINGRDKIPEEQARIDAETLIRAAPPEWACWKTGVELSCFGAKLLRVCQLEDHESYYGGEKSLAGGVFVKNRNTDVLKRVAIEIVAPSITLSIEKFTQSSGDDERRNLVGFRVVSIKNTSVRASCKLLVITVEHIDNLLAEWYPKIDSLSNIHGIKAVRRVSFCDQCLQASIDAMESSERILSKSIAGNDIRENVCDRVVMETDNTERSVFTPDMPEEVASAEDVNISFDEGGSDDGRDGREEVDAGNPESDFGSLNLSREEKDLLRDYRSTAKGQLVAFELEEGSKLLRLDKPLICPFHLDVEPKNIFPDLCFLDLEEKNILQRDHLKQGRFLGGGSYGDVFSAKLTLSDGRCIETAMKIPMNSQKEKTSNVMQTMFSFDTYRTVRQELAILIPVNHVNIISFLGVCVAPFSMVLELAPMGALDDRYKDYLRVGKMLNPFVIQKSLQQISSALKYLHRHQIIYRDLKCENVLVWAFPGPTVADPSNHQVLLKLTDYGISRSVSLGGIKGFLGTPGFMAPEILKYTGKESYSAKVDCFSFGSLMYELISLHPPYGDLINEKARHAQHNMQCGKRPKLTSKEKRTPLLMTSLMHRCWAQNPEDRPTAAEICGLTSLPEFPKLLDSIGLEEGFNLQCVTTTNQSRVDCSVADSRSVVGSHLWFCGYQGLSASVSARKEGIITVISYHDGRYSHANNLKIRDRVLQVCSVGSFVWLATESGLIQVFCALTYKPVALGYNNYRYVLKITHSAVCGHVLVSFSDGSILAYDDNITKHNENISPKQVSDFFYTADRNTSIRKLQHRLQYTGHYKTHCMAGIESHVVRRFSEDVYTYNDGRIAVATQDSEAEMSENISPPVDLNQVTHELWCGQDQGRITILDIKTLRVLKTLPFTGTDLRDPILKELKVQFIEISRNFHSNLSSSSQSEEEKEHNRVHSQYLWIVAYPGTKVVRWDVNKRVPVNAFDASKHSPWHDLNSVKISKKTKALRAPDSQICSLAVVERTMYVGTTFGCLIICDALTMDVTLSLRCYDGFIETIIPLRMIASRNREENAKKMVLSCGRKCLDFWVNNVNNKHYVERKKRVVLKELTILTWQQ